MSYSIIWEGRSVHVNYFGEINNQEIESAHFSLNGDARFYDCQSLVLDISECNMDDVDVDELLTIIATDLGASETIKDLKVAMIAVSTQNVEKASRYIDQCRRYGFPWDFKLFNSLDTAREWLGS